MEMTTVSTMEIPTMETPTEMETVRLKNPAV